MSQKYIIFDLFGTLIGSIPSTEKLYIELMNKTFPGNSYHELNKFISCNDFGSIDSCALESWKHFGIIKDQKDLEVFKEKIEEWKNFVQLQDGAIEVLTELKKRGCKLGLITNDNNLIGEFIEKFGLEKYFDVIISSYKVGIAKPNPEIYKLCAQKLGAEMSEIIMVGDKLDRDVEPPIALGMRGILYDPEEKNLEYPNRITSLKELIEK